MQNLALFEFPESSQEVSVYIDGSDRPWFRATNVCAILGFANPTVALQTYCPDSFKEYKIGMGRPANYVSESGLYRLMLVSKAPIAERFRDWVCDEVLPQIRKTGHFGNVPNQQSEASEFWQLIDGAIERGLAPETVVDLHRRFNGVKPPKVGQKRSKRKSKRESEPISQEGVQALRERVKFAIKAEDSLNAIVERLREIHTTSGWITPRDAKRKTRLIKSTDHAKTVFAALAAQDKGSLSPIGAFKFR